MIDIQRRRLPAIRCWINHLIEGKFLNEKKMLNTIFGIVKRVRIIGTIVEKKINVGNEISNNMISEYYDEISNARIEFDLDDGTGLIRAIIWGADTKANKNFKIGDLVDVIGLINYKYNNLLLSIEIIKKIENPNKLLLRDAEIIVKIKSGKITDFDERENEESDLDLLFLNQPPNQVDHFKEKIFSIIESFSQGGNGISFKELKNKIDISEDKLRIFIRDLEMESKIYQSEENFYQTY